MIINLITQSGRKPSLGWANAQAIQVGVLVADTLGLGSFADQSAYKTFFGEKQ